MSELTPSDPFTPFIHLLFTESALQIPENTILTERLTSIEVSKDNEDVQVSWQVQNAESCLGTCRFGGHTIQIIGLAEPLPSDVVDRTIQVTHWQPQIKAAMRQHVSYLTLVYAGSHPDPIEKMLALYKFAHAFANENLVGIANAPAWTAHPIGEFLSPEKILSYRRSFPFMLWIGYVKFYVDKDRYWWVTKGHHIFDVPDLACFVGSKKESAGITDQFANIFYYLNGNDVMVTAGDTLQIGQTEAYLQFSEVPENAEYLMGPSGTLVIEATNAEDAAPAG